MTQRGSGRGRWTHWKDEHLPVVGEKVLAASANAARKHQAYHRIAVIDLTAGWGIDPHDGRPSIVLGPLDWAVEHRVAVDAYLCEQDGPRYQVLTRVLQERYGRGFTVRLTTYADDCRLVVDQIINDLAWNAQIAGKDPRAVYGLVLVDPCGFVPWTAVRAVCNAFPHLDVLLNVGAATIKWFKPSLGIPSLDQELHLFHKDNIWIGPLHDNWQWVALLMSNFDYGDSKKHDLIEYRSPAGRQRFLQAIHTRAELQRLYQPSLWSSQEEGRDGHAAR